MTTAATDWAIQTGGVRGRPAVVLLHSIATSNALWQSQLPVWSNDFYVIAPDLPGHGATAFDPRITRLEDYADGLAALLDRLEIQQAALVGVSLGGMIAQAFTLRYPQRVTALVLAQTSARTPPAVVDMWNQRKQAAREQGMHAQVSATLQRWFTEEFRQAAPLTTKWIGNLIAQTSIEGYSAAVEAIQHLDYLEQLKSVTARTLVVAGADDTAASPALAEAICKALPNARLTIIEHAAHLANIEQATRFTEVVGEFLGDVLSSRSNDSKPLAAAGGTQQ